MAFLEALPELEVLAAKYGPQAAQAAEKYGPMLRKYAPMAQNILGNSSSGGMPNINGGYYNEGGSNQIEQEIQQVKENQMKKDYMQAIPMFNLNEGFNKMQSNHKAALGALALIILGIIIIVIVIEIQKYCSNYTSCFDCNKCGSCGKCGKCC